MTAAGTPAMPGARGGPTSTFPDRRRTLLAVAVVAAIAFGVAQLELLLSRTANPNESLLIYAAGGPALFAVVLGVAYAERRSLREYGFCLRGPVAATVLFSALLVMIYIVVELYPGILYGFGRVPALPVIGFGAALLSAPLLALGQEAMFRGYLYRSLSRVVTLPVAMAVSASIFAVSLTNFVGLPTLGTVAGGEYLFGTTVGNLVLGLLLSLQFYKERWSLLGPVATRTGVLWAATLLPVAADLASWEVAYAVLLGAYGTMLAVVAIGLKEPRLQAHRYLREPFGPRRLRFRERARARQDARSAVGTLAAVAVVIVATTQFAPVALGARPPLLAIATGSMVPTLHRGTLVVLGKATPANIHVGTIIAFHVSCLPDPTVHRVIRIVRGGTSPIYQTKGDANPVQDPCTVPYADVIGRVVAIVPVVGLLVLDPLLDGAIIVLIILVALLAPRRRR